MLDFSGDNFDLLCVCVCVWCVCVYVCVCVCVCVSYIPVLTLVARQWPSKSLST